MKTIEISASYKRTVSVPEYGSMTYEAHRKGILEDGDNPDDCYDALALACKTDVRRQMLPSLREARFKLTEVFEHLPESVKSRINEALREAE